ncbi:hypothetical protein BB560_004875 [Smittium megazygosporum]|uniref:Ubiquitin-like 1-activating enzyme E1A n=1 Tax=Smittium megazygosporum TaxID=133381 RepID=A0A2T9Z806_9FUNG|nr:hypothetical protein BB560_004875 [Smittium megazygosporum]
MSTLSSEQLSRYDRQIRLWGFEGQKRVLFIGVNQFMLEALKNLVLGGIGHLTIVDDQVLTDQDINDLYILNKDDIGIKKGLAISKKLVDFNTAVDISTGLSEKCVDEEFISTFQLVVLSNPSFEENIRINELCRKTETKFISSNLFGTYGYIFCDLFEHTYKINSKSSTSSDTSENKPKTDTFSESYTSLQKSTAHIFEKVSMRKTRRLVSPLYFILLGYMKLYDKNQLSQKDLLPNADDLNQIVFEIIKSSNIYSEFIDKQKIRTFLECLNLRLASFSSVLGGILAQEIIKVISGKDLPISNWLFFDSLESDALIYKIS